MAGPVNKTAAMTQIGQSGLNRLNGVGLVDEEFLSELRGRNGIRVYTEMWNNDPIVNSMIFAIDMFMRRTKWHVQAAGDDPKSQADAQFVEECMDDMSHTWPELISEINSMLVYGWSFFELVYKRRQGNKTDNLGNALSKYNDNKIGWRKIEIRSQSSFWQWEFDEDGSIAGMTQMPAPTYQILTIPIEKALLFRTTARKNSPEGASVLRAAYRPWYFKKRIEEIEGVGVERDLAGLPFATVPAQMLSANASDQQKALLQSITAMVKNVRRDQVEGVIWPMEYDEQGKPLYEFKLLNSGGTRQFETNTIITRYEQRMAMTVLADFILLGNDSSGSFALGVSKSSMFQSALAAWLDGIQAVFNNYAVPRLFRLNGIEGPYPTIRHEEVQKTSLQDLAVFISALAGAGAQLFPDVELENSLRESAMLPLREESQEDKDKEDKLRETSMDTNIASAQAAMKAAREGTVPGAPQPGADLPGYQQPGKQPGSVPGAPTKSTGPVKSKLPPTQRRNTIGVKASQNVSQ